MEGRYFCCCLSKRKNTRFERRGWGGKQHPDGVLEQTVVRAWPVTRTLSYVLLFILPLLRAVSFLKLQPKSDV